NIVSVSSSSIFLSYLYGRKKIVHALTLNDVKKFFNKNSYQQMIESTQNIIDTLQGLQESK
ncbi:TPA: hypothetical protein JBK63_15710, partial [Legionella pneumophila]|nr:hypothetical protein [Legionella pneumophila]